MAREDTGTRLSIATRPALASRAVALVVFNAGIGAVAGLVFALGVLVSDGFGLGTLVWRDDGAAAALALWFGGTMAGFAAFAVATAAMQGSDPDRGGGVLAPVRLRANRHRPSWAGGHRPHVRRTH